MRSSLSLSRFSLASDGLLWQSMAAVVSALLLLLSFPPFELSFLAWVALAPLLKVIAGGVTTRRALWLTHPIRAGDSRGDHALPKQLVLRLTPKYVTRMALSMLRMAA